MESRSYRSERSGAVRELEVTGGRVQVLNSLLDTEPELKRAIGDRGGLTMLGPPLGSCKYLTLAEWDELVTTDGRLR